jgi:carboxymethylenebutenolidase
MGRRRNATTRADDSRRHPVVVVIPGNFIAEEYIPNTCVALAKAGYVGIAPNIYHPIPPEVRPDDASTDLKAAFGVRKLGDMEILEAAVGFPSSTTYADPERVAVLGFCRGGRLALLTAARVPSVRAVVAFHPAPLTPEELSPVKVPVQIHHGLADQSVPSAASENTANALRMQKTQVDLFLYPGCDHGFLAYTRPFYNAEAGIVSWRRTTEFLERRFQQ